MKSPKLDKLNGSQQWSVANSWGGHHDPVFSSQLKNRADNPQKKISWEPQKVSVVNWCCSIVVLFLLALMVKTMSLYNLYNQQSSFLLAIN